MKLCHLRCRENCRKSSHHWDDSVSVSCRLSRYPNLRFPTVIREKIAFPALYPWKIFKNAFLHSHSDGWIPTLTLSPHCCIFRTKFRIPRGHFNRILWVWLLLGPQDAKACGKSPVLSRGPFHSTHLFKKYSKSQ